MKLYHASKAKFEKIERRQASVAEGIEVPEGELRNKIYFSPDFGFALANGVGPEGMTSISNGTISFENEDQFDPEQKIYIYEIDSESIPEELIEHVDNEQLAIDLDEVEPLEMHERVARDVFEYYEHVAWKHPDELNKEMKLR